MLENEKKRTNRKREETKIIDEATRRLETKQDRIRSQEQEELINGNRCSPTLNGIWLIDSHGPTIAWFFLLFFSLFSLPSLCRFFFLNLLFRLISSFHFFFFLSSRYILSLILSFILRAHFSSLFSLYCFFLVLHFLF